MRGSLPPSRMSLGPVVLRSAHPPPVPLRIGASATAAPHSRLSAAPRGYYSSRSRSRSGGGGLEFEFGCAEIRRFSTAREKEAAPSFAFAFDIDGVLLHVAKPIPGATETLRFLQAHDIPFILLTNGGGTHESDRVRDLSERLGVPLTTDNFVQSHTPFRQLVDGEGSSSAGDGGSSSSSTGALRDKTVLVTGADAQKCREIAERYGFRNVVIPADILAAHPAVWPFDPLMAAVYARQARPLPRPIFTPGTASTVSVEDSLKIDAVFVFNDPRDWALDTQLITDLLLSHAGHLGTYSPRNGDASLPGCGWQADGQPEVYFSNGDLFWSTGFHLPRFGQGAFQAAVAGVWRRVTGGHELRRRVLGKPSAETYRFAERVLRSHRHDILLLAAKKQDGDSATHEPTPALRAVYMVGDNPESDIAGANDFQASGASEAGAAWRSVLVRTGVWSPDRAGGVGALQGRLRPEVVVDDVRDAVRWALREEGWRGSGLE